MIKKFLEKISVFVSLKRKSFLFALSVFSAMFLAFMIRPGLFVTDFIGWISLTGAVLVAAAIVISYVVKVEEKESAEMNNI
jgi:hypothetical protein